MKNFLGFLLLVTVSCSSTHEIASRASTAPVDLNGTWVGSYNDDLQFVLLVDESPMRLSVKIMGRSVTPLDYKKRGDQALIKFKNGKGEIYHLLAQVHHDNKMRFSITSEEINEFMPLGMLGEKVYRLQKMEMQQYSLSAASASAQPIN